MGLTALGAGFVYGEGTAFATRALSGVTLDVEPGELTVVIGATGSGKSTLLRLLAGIAEPTEGEVMVDGARTCGRGVSRGVIGLVFQRPESQLFAETVADDVAFGPRNLGRSETEAHEDAAAALREVGLDAETFGPRSPFTLSGGEARRVAVAGIVAMRPRYLLLDEPTAGLDAEGRGAVTAAVQRAREHAGVVVVTHDAEEFVPSADRVLVLADGAIAFAGTPQELLADPHPLEAAGLALPAVLDVQVRAREAGLALTSLTFDPHQAAQRIAEALAAR